MNKEQSSREGTSENPTSIENRTTVWGNREKTLVPGRLEPPTFDLSHTCLLTEPQLSETHLLPPLHLHPHSLSSSCIWFLTINRKQAFHISRRFYSMSLVNSASQPPRQPFHPKSSVLILSQWPCFLFNQNQTNKQELIKAAFFTECCPLFISSSALGPLLLSVILLSTVVHFHGFNTIDRLAMPTSIPHLAHISSLNFIHTSSYLLNSSI